MFGTIGDRHPGLASLVLWLTAVLVGLTGMCAALYLIMALRARRRRQRLS